MDKTTFTMVQRRLLRGQQILTLEGNRLTVQSQRGLSFQEYRFELRGLLPDPVRIRQVPTLAVIVLIPVSVLGLLLLPVGIIADALGTGKDMVGFSVTGFLLLVFATLGWIPTVRKLVNIVMFQGPGGRVILWPDLPSKEEFNRFLAVLIARIRNTQNCEQPLLRQLRRAEIIDDWQYDQAMEWLQQKAGQPDDQ